MKKYYLVLFLFCASLIKAEEAALLLSLKDSMNRALMGSFDWKKAQMKDDLYNQLIVEYWREYFPKIGVGFSNELSRVEGGSDTRGNKVNFSLEQLLYDGGKISHAKEIARLEKQLNSVQAQDIERIIKLKVLTVFFEVLGLEKKIELQKEFLKRMEQQIEIASKELELGEITRLDFLEIQTKTEDERFNLNKLKSQLETQVSQFKSMLKISMSQNISLKNKLFENFSQADLKNIKELFSLKKLIDLGISRKKEIAQFYINHKKAAEELKLIQKSYIPTVSLVGSYGLEGEEMPRNKSYSIGFVIQLSLGGNSLKSNTNSGVFSNGQGVRDSAGANFNVLDNLSLWGSQYIQNQMKVMEIMEEEKNFRKQTEIEIQSLMNTIDITRESYFINKKKMNLIEERLSLSQTKMEIGEIKRIDLVAVEIEKLKAQLETVSTLVSFVITASEMESKLSVPIGYLKLFQLDMN